MTPVVRARTAAAVSPAPLGTVPADLRGGPHDVPFAEARLADGAALPAEPAGGRVR